MGKNSKRPKSYYISSNTKSGKRLSVGMKGFLCTCESYEKECVKEAYNILNETADSLYGKESNSEKSKDLDSAKEDEIEDSDDEVDFEARLKRDIDHVKKLQADIKNNIVQLRFQQVNSGAKNCIFISSTLTNPVELSLKIMDIIIDKGTAVTKHLIKLIPVQITCKAFEDSILKAVVKLSELHLPVEHICYSIAFKLRNNSSLIKKNIVLSIQNYLYQRNNLNHHTEINPDYTLHIEVIKSLCCLSFLPSYMDKYKKYNLISLGTNKC